MSTLVDNASDTMFTVIENPSNTMYTVMDSAVVYIAGWVVRKVTKTIDCNKYRLALFDMKGQVTPTASDTKTQWWSSFPILWCCSCCSGKGGKKLILGDFNVSSIDWNSVSTSGGVKSF
ncbi:hypothetical protein HELRODRAFT_180334 [Helobdella robusta]|uniref:Endonuclease/exonuclease/phosphatase domain-containing protein n=1 Tax=Helobdella robusta TaxID=6412 RepID=T1FFR7_HELRO|nr:hypothetical protein HELRODRAFT_180334 [Helobdella robusta]ESN93927.1 hypothetical protein HELRODRAFT_180334 [Helobdella robusta]